MVFVHALSWLFAVALLEFNYPNPTACQRRPLRPEVFRYYRIVNSNKNNNLAVHPESYHNYLKKVKTGERLKIADYPKVVVALPAGGDYEKWYFNSYGAVKEIINKATGLTLVTMPMEDHYKIYAVERNEHKGPAIDGPEHNHFIFKSASDNVHFKMTPINNKSFALSTYVTPDFPGFQYAEVKGLLGEGEKNSYWRLEKVYCDPHPHELYYITHRDSGERLTIPHRPVDTYLKNLRNRGPDPRPYLFNFEFLYDNKVGYIVHPSSDKVLDIKGRENKYGAVLTLSDREPKELNQQFYILPTPGNDACIIGSEANFNYRYIGLGPKIMVGPPSNQTSVRQFILQDKTSTLDNFLVLTPYDEFYGEGNPI